METGRFLDNALRALVDELGARRCKNLSAPGSLNTASLTVGSPPVDSGECARLAQNPCQAPALLAFAACKTSRLSGSLKPPVATPNPSARASELHAHLDESGG